MENVKEIANTSFIGNKNPRRGIHKRYFTRMVKYVVTYCHQKELLRVYKLWKAKVTPRTPTNRR